jgi:hypothetical protein
VTVSGDKVSGLALADLDGDGTQDISALSVSDSGTSRTDVLWGSATGIYTPSTKSLPGGDFLSVGDFNGDTLADLLIGNKGELNVVRGRSSRELRSRVHRGTDGCQLNAAALTRVQRIDGARAKEIALIDNCAGEFRLGVLSNKLLVQLKVEPKGVSRNEIDLKITAVDAEGNEFLEPPTGLVYAVIGKDAETGTKSTLDEKGVATIRVHASGTTRVSVLYMGDEKYAAASRVLTFATPIEEARLRRNGRYSDAVYRLGAQTDELMYAVQRTDSAARLLYVDIPGGEWHPGQQIQNGQTYAYADAYPNAGIFATVGGINNETYSGSTGTTFVFYAATQDGWCTQYPYQCGGNTSGHSTFTYYVDGVAVGSDSLWGYQAMYPSYWEAIDSEGDYNVYYATDYYSITNNGVGYTFRTPGTHTVGFKADGDPSYSGTTTVTITGKALPLGSLSVAPGSISFGQNATMTATFSPVINSTGTVTFYANGSSIGSAGINTSGVATLAGGSSLGAGSYTITATYGGDGNNNGATTNGVTLTVSKITPTVAATIVSSTITYGQTTNVSVHVGCNVACGQVDYRLDGSEWGTVSLDGSGNFTAGTGSTWNAGSHSILIKYLGNTNYNPADSNTLSLTINKATPTLSWATPAAITYGTPLTSVQLNATASVPGTFVYTPASSNVLPAGSQNLSATFTPTDMTNYNSGITANVLIAVNKAVITVTANNASKMYGAALPAFTAAYSGFVNGDSTAVVTGTPSLTTTAAASSPAGTYTITAGTGSLTATNYSFVFVNGTLTVSKVVLNVSANNASRTYGGANPSFTPTYSGFVNGDTAAVLSGAPSLTTTATAASPVGSYPIAVSLGTLSAANYTFSFSNGSLTVNKAILFVTATDSSRTYNTANPIFSASYAGFVNGDTAAVLSGASSVTTTATISSPVGTYPITPAVGTLASANYSFTFVNGTLTITKGTPIPTWATPSSITYGTALSGAQLNATASVPGTFAYSPAAGTLLSAGTQTLSVTFTPTDAANYTNGTGSVTLVVTRATATVAVTSTLNPSSFGDTVTFNIVVSGAGATPSGSVVVTDGATTLQTMTLDASGHATYTTSALVAGGHSITATYGGNSNYQ